MSTALRVAMIAGLTLGQTTEANSILQNVQKFLWHCKTSCSTLTESIEGSTANVSQVQPDIEAVEVQPDIEAGAYEAVAALEKGASGAFLQTQSADMLRNIVQPKASMNDADRDELRSCPFQGADCSPASGEIIGIFKQLGYELFASFAETTYTDNPTEQDGFRCRLQSALRRNSRTCGHD